MITISGQEVWSRFSIVKQILYSELLGNFDKQWDKFSKSNERYIHNNKRYINNMKTIGALIFYLILQKLIYNLTFVELYQSTRFFYV